MKNKYNRFVYFYERVMHKEMEKGVFINLFFFVKRKGLVYHEEGYDCCDCNRHE